MIWTLLACGSAAPSPEGATTDDATTAGPAYLAPAPDAPSGTCPAWSKQGDQTMTSDGEERTIVAHWPKNPDGPIGLVFAWHGLGDRADNFASALDLESLAKQENALVVAPYSLNPLLNTWDYLGGGGADLALFYDVRACAAQGFDLDLDRVSTFGFSFGALWTTFLTIEASDVLAGALTFSGGTGPAVGLSYASPATSLPVLVAWGGDDDTYNAGMIQVDFQETSMDFADHLEGDGHTVVRCNHGLGHTMPSDWDGAVRTFLLTQRFGVASAFADGDVSALPTWCASD